MEEIEVKIINWEKHQPKTDAVRHPHWFKLKNDMPNNEALFGLTAETKWVWICLLCLASKKRSGVLKFKADWFGHWAGGIATQNVTVAITSLQLSGIIECAQSFVHDTRSRLEERRIEENRGENTGERKIEKNSKKANLSVRPPDFGSKEVIAHYCEEYKTRYGGNPTITGKTAGQVKSLLKTLSVCRVKDLISVYLQTEDPWFLKVRHRFSEFSSNLEQLGASLEKGSAIEAHDPFKNIEKEIYGE